MAKKQTRDRFEDLAFRCEISARPGNVTAQLAYTDWLQEHAGLTVMGAKRVVARLVREEVELRLLEGVKRWLFSDAANAVMMRRQIQNMLDADEYEYAPIRLMPNSFPPMFVFGSGMKVILPPDHPVRLAESLEVPSNMGGTPQPEWIEVGFRWVMRLSHQWGFGCPTTI